MKMACAPTYIDSGFPMYCAIMIGWHWLSVQIPPRQSWPQAPQFFASEVMSAQAFDAVQSVRYAAAHAIAHEPSTHTPEPVPEPVVGPGQVARQPVGPVSEDVSLASPTASPPESPMPPEAPAPLSGDLPLNVP
jgi:hypothetical protein